MRPSAPASSRHREEAPERPGRCRSRAAYELPDNFEARTSMFSVARASRPCFARWTRARCPCYMALESQHSRTFRDEDADLGCPPPLAHPAFAFAGPAEKL